MERFRKSGTPHILFFFDHRHLTPFPSKGGLRRKEEAPMKQAKIHILGVRQSIRLIHILGGKRAVVDGYSCQVCSVEKCICGSVLHLGSGQQGNAFFHLQIISCGYYKVIVHLCLLQVVMLVLCQRCLKISVPSFRPVLAVINHDVSGRKSGNRKRRELSTPTTQIVTVRVASVILHKTGTNIHLAGPDSAPVWRSHNLDSSGPQIICRILYLVASAPPWWPTFQYKNEAEVFIPKVSVLVIVTHCNRMQFRESLRLKTKRKKNWTESVRSLEKSNVNGLFQDKQFWNVNCLCVVLGI